jgi:hypothetical protein
MAEGDPDGIVDAVPPLTDAVIVAVASVTVGVTLTDVVALDTLAVV